MRTLPYQDEKTYLDLIEDIVIQLVDDDEAVCVREVIPDDDDENAPFLRVTLEVAEADKGKLIGKKGCIIGSIHKLLVAMSRGKHVVLELKDSNQERTDER